jgi:predicted enzyme related to lactoylglutathione lyase
VATERSQRRRHPGAPPSDEDELGIMDARYAAWPAGQQAGVVVHWHVDDLPAAVERLQDAGATVVQPPTVDERTLPCSEASPP